MPYGLLGAFRNAWKRVLMDERAELVLKPSWLTIGGAVVFALFAVFIARTWAIHALGHGSQGLWDLAFPLGIVAVAVVGAYRSLRTVTLLLTPAGLTVATGKSAQTVPWRDVEAILPKRIWKGRGSSLGTAIVRKTRGDIRLRDTYQTPRQEVYGFLAGYANVHAPHVTTTAIDGPPGL